MSWVSIPNDPVRNFQGRIMRNPKIDADLEIVYKPIRCPKKGCEFASANLKTFSEHVRSEHAAEADNLQFATEMEMEETTLAGLLLALLNRTRERGTREKPNPMEAIQRNNDGEHASEVWRRAWIAYSTRAPNVKLKSTQHEWLKQLLDRKLPIAKDAKERGEEQQTVAMHLYDFSEYSVRQAILTLPERLKPSEADPEEADAVAGATQA